MLNLDPQTVPREASHSMGSGPVLVLAAHPGDDVMGCGGAVMRHLAARDPVRVIVVADCIDSGADAVDDNLRRGVRGEANCAAALFGCAPVSFWGFPENGIEYGELLVGRILDAIASMEACLVYSPSWWESHHDHRALAVATAEAVRRSALNPSFVMYEIGVPLRPNRLLDISDLEGRKQTAIHCFESRIARQPYDQQVASLNRFRTYTLPSTVAAAEAYHLVAQEDLRSSPKQICPPEHRGLCSPVFNVLSEPLVSVLVRSINRASLTEALDSIALQTYPHIEILVVDASGGKHCTLPLWWGRFPLRFISSTGPLGRSAAANRGMSEAQGEFWTFLDDDDLVEPDHVSTLVEGLSAVPGQRCVYTGVRVDYLNNGECVRSETLSHPFNRHQLRARNYIPIHAALFHRSLYEDGCRFDETLETLEDWDFWLQLSLLTDFIHVDKITARYRNSGASGFGDQIAAAQLQCSTAAVFEKWRSRWRGTEWAETLLDRDRMRDELACQANDLRRELDTSREMLQESRQRTELMSRRIKDYQAALAGAVSAKPGPEARKQDHAEDDMPEEAPDVREHPTSGAKSMLGRILSRVLARPLDPPPAPSPVLDQNTETRVLSLDTHRPTEMLTPRHLGNARVLEHRGRILELVPRGSICCEVGVGEAVFSRQILNEVHPRRLHLVDIDPHRLEHARSLFVAEVGAGQVETHLGDSAEMLSQFPSQYFDWIYLDASPTYELVRGDLEVCRTRVKDDGWIIVHNYIYWDHVIGLKYGVMEATNEFCLAHDYELLYLALHSESFNDAVIRRTAL
jgi:LmbE family N-acetylglucosaminyl deacetylase